MPAFNNPLAQLWRQIFDGATNLRMRAQHFHALTDGLGGAFGRITTLWREDVMETTHSEQRRWGPPQMWHLGTAASSSASSSASQASASSAVTCSPIVWSCIQAASVFLVLPDNAIAWPFQPCAGNSSQGVSLSMHGVDSRHQSVRHSQYTQLLMAIAVLWMSIWTPYCLATGQVSAALPSSMHQICGAQSTLPGMGMATRCVVVSALAHYAGVRASRPPAPVFHPFALTAPPPLALRPVSRPIARISVRTPRLPPTSLTLRYCVFLK